MSDYTDEDFERDWTYIESVLVFGGTVNRASADRILAAYRALRAQLDAAERVCEAASAIASCPACHISAAHGLYTALAAWQAVKDGAE